MPQMLKQAGIQDPSTQLLLTAINPFCSMMGAIYGASLLDKLGRRKMLLGGLAGGLFAYCLLRAFTAESEDHPDLGYGVIVAIYIFGIFFVSRLLFGSRTGTDENRLGNGRHSRHSTVSSVSRTAREPRDQGPTSSSSILPWSFILTALPLVLRPLDGSCIWETSGGLVSR